MLLQVGGGIIAQGDQIEKRVCGGQGCRLEGQGLPAARGVSGLKDGQSAGLQGLRGEQIGLAGTQGIGGSLPGNQLTLGGQAVADRGVFTVQHLIGSVSVQVGQIVHLDPDPVYFRLNIEGCIPGNPVDAAGVADRVIGLEGPAFVPAVDLHPQSDAGEILVRGGDEK